MKIIDITRTTYPADGSLAVMADTDEGAAVLSVNLGAYGLTPHSPDEFYVKDYAENQGLAKELAEQDIATPIASVEVGPFNSRCVLMKLIDPTARRS